MTNYINYEYIIQKHNIKGKETKNRYDEDFNDLKEELNSMGEQAWQLCAIIPTTGEDANFVYKRICLPEKFKICGTIDYSEVVEEEDIFGIFMLRNVLIQLHNQLDGSSVYPILNEMVKNINDEMKEILGIDKFRKFENVAEVEITENGRELQKTTIVKIADPNIKMQHKKIISYEFIKRVLAGYIGISEDDINEKSLYDSINDNIYIEE